MHLESVGAVFEIVLDLPGRGWEFAGSADRDETDPQFGREEGTEDETTGLWTDDRVGSPAQAPHIFSETIGDA
jgi:hypothetical protein